MPNGTPLLYANQSKPHPRISVIPCSFRVSSEFCTLRHIVNFRFVHLPKDHAIAYIRTRRLRQRIRLGRLKTGQDDCPTCDPGQASQAAPSFRQGSSQTKPSNRPKPLSKVTSRQPWAIASAARWASVMSFEARSWRSSRECQAGTTWPGKRQPAGVSGKEPPGRAAGLSARFSARRCCSAPAPCAPPCASAYSGCCAPAAAAPPAARRG